MAPRAQVVDFLEKSIFARDIPIIFQSFFDVISGTGVTTAERPGIEPADLRVDGAHG